MSGDPSFGLSALSPHVARAVTTTYGHHRTPWFEHVLCDIAARLEPALGDRYTPLFLTCTGLGGREAAVANLIRPGDRVQATEGDFSRLARAFGADVHPLTGTWLEGPALDAVFVEHVSSSGQVHDIRAVVTEARRLAPRAPVVLDASISFGVDFTDLRATGVDAVLIVPERGLMGIPGVTVFAVTEAFIETVTRRRSGLADQPFLFDLLRYHRAWAKRTTPYSPNISACVALQAALEHIDANGGLQELPRRHRLRAEAIRAQAVERGFRLLDVAPTSSNAFTSLVLPETIDVSGALRQFTQAGIEARRLGPSSVQLAHVGWTAETVEEDLEVEPPFTIRSSEFIEQAGRLAVRASEDQRLRSKLLDSARRVFRDRHTVHDDALRHRVVGFVGSGRIVRSLVELCRKRGMDKLMAYSPSLSAGKGVHEWRERGVEVARTLDELFTTAHVVVLLPVLYDDLALRLFRKPRIYHNHGLVSAERLDQAEKAGRLDLIVNAAARGALIDRTAVASAVRRGWLRYYSDEMPAADDPLIGLDEVRYTAHVGGSCRAPQAAVARNTHKILQRLLGTMLDGDEPGDYRLNVVNAHLLGGRAAQRREAAAREIARSRRIRVLLTDPFDIESLGFDRLAAAGATPDVHDISAGPMSSERLMAALDEVRPHVVMVRSRTRVDDATAAALVRIPELAFVLRPGVGVDNLYGGLERLSAEGVQIINEPYGNSSAVAEMALHFVLSGTEETILAPGPTKFNADVFDVGSRYNEVRLSRGAETTARVGRALGRWLGARRDTLVLSGPGTAMMEASIASLTPPGSRGLVISHGKFGDRFAGIARARGRACEMLQIAEVDWGAAITPGDVERYLGADAASKPDGQRISFVCFQQNETSSGVTYHEDSIRSLVAAARAYNPQMIVIADAISGALAHRLDAGALGLDILFLGSQKALGVSSGLAFGVLSDRALAGMLARSGYAGDLDELCADPSADRYLDAFDRRHRVHSISLLRLALAARRNQLVDTPSIFHLASTDRALDLFDREGGPDAVAARHAELARLVRQGVRALGLALMPSAPYESDSVAVVLLPAGVNASTIRKAIARHTGITVAGAQGDYWKSRMLRVGTLGFVSRADVVRCLRALRLALVEAGHTPWPSESLAIPGRRS